METTNCKSRWSHLSAFFWRSRLSDNRKKQIIAWLATLDADKQKMVEELADDAAQEAEYDCNAD